MLLQTIKRFTDKHYKIFNFIYFITLIIFGITVGYNLNVDSIQDNCNQHIVDNYFTRDVQNCIMKFNSNYSLPYEFDYINLSSIIQNE